MHQINCLLNKTILVQTSKKVYCFIQNDKRVRPTKNKHQQQGISYLEREREGWVGMQAGQ
jgi:hypothetical protein